MANEIKTFRMSRMTLGACGEFHSNVNHFIVLATPAALHIEAQAAAYVASLERLQMVVNRRTKLVSTTLLRRDDKVRDRAIGTINEVVKDYETTPVVEKSEAAIRLSAKLSAYKGIQRHEYRKQTFEVKGMLAVLTDPENAADIELLGLTKEVEMLAQSNASFETAFIGKTEELSELSDVKDLDSEEIVDQINGIYEQIVKMVNAYALIQPTETINAFIKNVNGVVDAYSDFGNGTTSDGSSEDTTTPEDGSGTEDETPEGDSSEGGETPDTGGTDGGSDGGETPDTGGTGGGTDDDEEVVG